MNDKNPYANIIDMPRHISKTRRAMPLSDRAPQFAPFATLTGFEERVDEAARLTDRRGELDDETAFLLNERLVFLKESAPHRPDARVTFFVPDEKKAGGAYFTAAGKVRRIDEINRVLIMTDKTKIPLDDIVHIDIEKLTATDAPPT